MRIKASWKRFAIIIAIGTTLPYLMANFFPVTTSSSAQQPNQSSSSDSTAHLPSETWMSPDDRYGAVFPGEVEKLSGEGRDGEVTAYVSGEESDQGVIVYQITRYALSPQLEELGPRRALEAILKEKSRLVSPTELLEMEWQSFGTNNKRLSYRQAYDYQGSIVRERGFFLTHQGEVVEVKTQSTRPDSLQASQAIEYFLDSFVIVH
ncbi:hypothetical protein [Halomonas aquatica]|uniref:Uncharacterized protein n=1 Tax=Halomonas aquatica TaxID=3151123 RepID=A0ABV1NK11_9GAMM